MLALMFFFYQIPTRKHALIKLLKINLKRKLVKLLIVLRWLGPREFEIIINFCCVLMCVDWYTNFILYRYT